MHPEQRENIFTTLGLVMVLEIYASNKAFILLSYKGFLLFSSKKTWPEIWISQKNVLSI